MKSTKQVRSEAKQLFRLCQVNGTLDEQRVRQLTQRVIEGKRRGYLAVLAHYHRLVKAALARRTAEVESAVTLPGDLRAGIQTDLARLYGPGLSFVFTDRPALIGGVRIKVGSNVYDGSVLAKLAELENKF